ncbi:hypothetical protein ASZ90_010481 [hydrocarbon metagenome]|uniref:Uncharacterized protein n=1 Tax=hydrocarbon metagenome TaxID=938273 RepID=A0A0W8FFY9_9ZZZZ
MIQRIFSWHFINEAQKGEQGFLPAMIALLPHLASQRCVTQGKGCLNP